MRGIVFDVKRYAIHDGPGIRTTIFLKGCHLRCKWCCNPESQKLYPEILFIKEKCTLCDKCIEVCPNGAHQTVNDQHTLNYSQCTNCGDCVEICLFNAVKMVGKEMDVDALMNTIERDRKYYENSGGGMTLSGGDPLFQHSFSGTLLKRAKESRIHTCIETAGFVNRNILEIVIPYVDLFLYDYKISDSKLHRQYTGVNNDKILANLEFLNECNSSVILRCPIIPGVNNDDNHFSNIAALCKQHENIKGVEIMPYHDFGKMKYEQLGKKYDITVKPPTYNETEGWIKRLQYLGCKNVKKG